MSEIGKSADQRSYRHKAFAAWNDAPPDWIVELASHADANGSKGAGKAIGYSSPTISIVLNRGGGIEKFDIGRIEQAVRGALMGATIACPRKGDMPRDKCLAWQASPRSIASPDDAKMYRACRSGCPHSRIKGGGDDH